MSDLEIYGTEVSSFVNEPLGVRVEVTNGKQPPKHLTGAYLMKGDRKVPVPSGLALLVEDRSEVRLSVGYKPPGQNVGFGVKVDNAAGTFVDELYFPSGPLTGWVYGLVDRDDGGRALELDSRRFIDKQFGEGTASNSWALTVSMWPILEWEDQNSRYDVNKPPVLTSGKRSMVDDAGGLVSGRSVGKTTSGRHMRIIRSASDDGTGKRDPGYRVFDLRIYLFVVSAEVLRQPVPTAPPS